MSKNKNNRTLLERLRYKYRLIVINEDTFEQKASLRLSRFNLYAGISVLSILLVAITTAIIAYTPLKYYMPGVGNIDIRSKLVALELEADSLQKEVNQRNFWINNFQMILSGDLDSVYYQSDTTSPIDLASIDLSNVTQEELELREEMESVENASIDMSLVGQSDASGVARLSFISLMNPLNGLVINTFNEAEDHLGLDIAGKEGSEIISVAEGTVVVADWNPETGYVLGIQHSEDLISFYKHNSVLLKKVGNFVNKGEAIAVIGNSGTLTTGPHLHFELWHKGSPLDPMELLALETL